MRSVSRESLESLIAKAKRAAARRGQRVTTAHPVLIMLQSDAEASEFLAERGIHESDVLQTLRGKAYDEPHSALEVAVERARKIALAMGETEARAVHLLLAIAREPRHMGARCLQELGVSNLELPKKNGSERAISPVKEARTQQRMLSTLKHAGAPTSERSKIKSEPPPAPTSKVALRGNHRTRPAEPLVLDVKQLALSAANKPRLQRPTATEVEGKQFPLLSTLGRNLTALAKLGQLDPVMGREPEINQVIEVLLRRRGHHPILVGAPGVGKTSVVEGLAQFLVTQRAIPDWLAKATIIELTAGSLVSGTGMRGALSERLRALAQEVSRLDHRVLLFFDDIHTLVGGPEGPDDLAVEFRALLSRGALHCLGATNESEYRKRFEKDPALSRRFTRIDVDEPSAEITQEIVEGVASRYEKHHGVRYLPEAVEASVQFATRFLTERHHPDKALTLIDMAGSRAARNRQRSVKKEDIIKAVASLSGIPEERLLLNDLQRLRDLEAELKSRIVGQDAAISTLAQALRKAAAGFRGARPWGTFLLLGPTGVGKTETAKVIQELLFPGGAFCRIDMSEYSEAHAISRLLGAPPGYIGHDEGGQLTDAVRRRPFQLVLLDEIDKAHRDVLLAMLPMLDEGRLTDAKGRLVDFRNTVVVMTSNLGVRPELFRKSMGFGSERPEQSEPFEKEVLSSVRRTLPPELWNRLDEVLCFRPLAADHIKTLAGRMIKEVAKMLLREYSATLDYDEAVLDFLIMRGGYDPELGARPMRRTVARYIEGLVANAVVNETITMGAALRIEIEGENLALRNLKSRKRGRNRNN